MSWGILDTQDKIWMGNDDGPISYEDEGIARIAAQMMDVMLGQQPGRCKVQTLPENASWKLRDEKKNKMSPEESIRKIEDGLI